MKRSLFVALSLLCFSCAFAQDPGANDDRATDRASLRELGRRYEHAINSGDLRQLAPSLAPTASAVFATNDEVRGLDAIQKYFDSIKIRLGRGSTYTVKLDPDTTEFYGDIALAHGRSDETAKLGSGSEFHFITHWTAVLRKGATGWQALRLQVTMDPLNNPAITARLQTRTLIVAALGVVAAGVAFALGRFLRKPQNRA